MMKRYRINKTTTFVEDNHSGDKEKYLMSEVIGQLKIATLGLSAASSDVYDRQG